LPVLEINGNRVERFAAAVENLEAVLVCVGLADEGAGLELDLVGGVVGGLVPDIQVLVR
jgi:hypothetical protein